MIDLPCTIGVEFESGHQDGPILVVTGEVDINTVAELSNALATALERHPKRVVVDVSEVSFMGSAGVVVLARANAAAWPHTDLAVVAAGPAARPLRLTVRETGIALYPHRSMALACTPALARA
ncbi:STAS domain-containing protein [Nocardia sp. XZ_19_385]|uniref:STAS domain-containing protein n=1 Tax=Nocardia sp. XZ_19_385 TaxID=2769488 RepID=UPI00189026A1|nr:STAS domain-containing protein [Nocardia sp. XZ_19_385]